ncbi:MAG: cytochrome c biogenesis protein CcdA [Rhizobiales bacterium]|nr:cytochrome c biogenesis protein CcdA [Hyphomicrobiales bacterium]
MGASGVGLGFLAGVLSILSPCVLPLLPMTLGAAASAHRAGPWALAAGLAISFAGIGLFVATIGFALGFDADLFRIVGAILMIALGAALMFPALQTRLAVAGGPLADWSERRFGGFSTDGLGGQFGVGLLLGAVWSPCVGPTLGAASVVAARGESLGAVAAVMIAFGLGAGLPLALLGLASRAALTRWRDRMMGAGKGLKAALGAGLAVFGLLVLTGLDKRVEAALVEASPAWITELTTRF